MKYDNADLKDLFQEEININSEQKALNARKEKFAEKKTDFIREYFKTYGIDPFNEIPTSHNTFISLPKFYLKKSDTSGKIMWVAQGHRITTKDGRATYGTATDELWQGQWEALPEGVRKLSIEKAKANSKPVFPISPSIFRGTDFSAPAYILHEAENGWQLVWRKAGTAYIDRMSGSKSASSGLQILFAGDRSKDREAWNEIKESFGQATGKSTTFSHTYESITEGGKLSVGLIEKEANKIDLIFGDGVAQAIIEKMKMQSANKSQKRKELKGESVSEENVEEAPVAEKPEDKPEIIQEHTEDFVMLGSRKIKL